MLEIERRKYGNKLLTADKKLGMQVLHSSRFSVIQL